MNNDDYRRMIVFGKPRKEYKRRFAGRWQIDMDNKPKKVGRNEICPCGSGVEYKCCCKSVYNPVEHDKLMQEQRERRLLSGAWEMIQYHIRRNNQVVTDITDTAIITKKQNEEK